MEIMALLNLVGWSIILIGHTISWWISKKEQKDIDMNTEFLHQSIKTGDNILIEEAKSKLKDIHNKIWGVGGSHSVRISGWLIATGVFLSNIIIFLNKF